MLERLEIEDVVCGIWQGGRRIVVRCACPEACGIETGTFERELQLERAAGKVPDLCTVEVEIGDTELIVTQLANGIEHYELLCEAGNSIERAYDGIKFQRAFLQRIEVIGQDNSIDAENGVEAIEEVYIGFVWHEIPGETAGCRIGRTAMYCTCEEAAKVIGIEFYIVVHVAGIYEGGIAQNGVFTIWLLHSHSAILDLPFFGAQQVFFARCGLGIFIT